ncbi:MAG: exodeoxyribonuclease VII small subunit [Nanoarchaeales archaeon]|nr:exodeoxyribonuclease VII small subunit [Nanoarchaeales archaeon]
MTTENKTKISYEDKIKRISEIVEMLETSEVPLEENITLVKEGAKLTKECKDYLEEAELIINKIVDGKELDFE